MSSRYEELERLQRLRTSGALSDAEFELEKKRLLGGAAPEPAAAPTTAVASEPGADNRKRNIVYAMAAIVGVTVAILAGLWLGSDVGGGKSAPEANVSIAQDAPAPVENVVVATPTLDVRSMPAPEQLSRAFAAAFGTAGAATLDLGGRTLSYRPGKLIWVGDRAVLLSPGTASDNCHACVGALAVHYLVPTDDGGFKVAGNWPEAVVGADFGAPPKWKLTGAFTEFPAIYEEGGFTGQGCTSAAVTITELTPAGPERSGPIPTLYGNESAAADTGAQGDEIQGTITNIQKDVGFDVTYSGTQPFTEHWTKKGARFALDGGETRMPQC